MSWESKQRLIYREVEIKPTFYQPFMTNCGQWTRNDGGKVSHGCWAISAGQNTDIEDIQALLSVTYGRENSCSSGIAMFFRRVGKRLRMTRETVRCSI